MLTHVLAVLGLGLLCAGWVVVQRWIAGQDPEQPGIEGYERCHKAGSSCSLDGCGSCEVEH